MKIVACKHAVPAKLPSEDEESADSASGGRTLSLRPSATWLGRPGALWSNEAKRPMVAKAREASRRWTRKPADFSDSTSIHCFCSFHFFVRHRHTTCRDDAGQQPEAIRWQARIARLD